MACIPCKEEKQTNNKQSRADTDENAPIDRIGGVIFTDLKGPMTPSDRRGNRYLMNFVDHNSNYYHFFLASMKDRLQRSSRVSCFFRANV